MTRINLTARERQAIQSVVEPLQDAGSEEVDRFLRQVGRGNENTIRRFVTGAYNHPITWWIGIFQLQMQKGMWGRRHQAAASIRANQVAQVTRPILTEAVNTLNGGDAPILSAVVAYNLAHRKADISGRLIGARFTHYASLAGRIGRNHLSRRVLGALGIANFSIASYGATIKALALGYRRAEAFAQSILTGYPENPPINVLQNSSPSLTVRAIEEQVILSVVINEVSTLTRVMPSPVPIAEFCARPENLNLASVCE